MKRLMRALALAALVLAPSARAQERVPGGNACVAPPAVETWQVPANEPHGIHELARTTKVALPPAVSSLDVELWGAGGGGGAGSIESISEGGYGGGGGASGAFARATVPIRAAEPLVVAIGRGGEGGDAHRNSGAGRDGAASLVCGEAGPLVTVAGGEGGRGGHANKTGGEGGRARDAATSAGDVRRAGNAGAPGKAPLFDLRGAGGGGGAAVMGSVQPPAAAGGAGGVGASTAQMPGSGAAGADGYAILRW